MILQAEVWSDVKCCTRLDSRRKEREQTFYVGLAGCSAKALNILFCKRMMHAFSYTHLQDVASSISAVPRMSIKQAATANK